MRRCRGHPTASAPLYASTAIRSLRSFGAFGGIQTVDREKVAADMERLVEGRRPGLASPHGLVDGDEVRPAGASSTWVDSREARRCAYRASRNSGSPVRVRVGERPGLHRQRLSRSPDGISGGDSRTSAPPEHERMTYRRLSVNSRPVSHPAGRQRSRPNHFLRPRVSGAGPAGCCRFTPCAGQTPSTAVSRPDLTASTNAW